MESEPQSLIQKIDYAGDALVQRIGEFLDGLTARARAAVGDFAKGCGERFRELTTAVSQKVSDMRPQPDPTPATAKSNTPSTEVAVEKVLSPADRMAGVKSALASIGYSPSKVGFQVTCEDMSADTPADLGGAGCATSYAIARPKSGMAMSMS